MKREWRTTKQRTSKRGKPFERYRLSEQVSVDVGEFEQIVAHKSADCSHCGEKSNQKNDK